MLWVLISPQKHILHVLIIWILPFIWSCENFFTYHYTETAATFQIFFFFIPKLQQTTFLFIFFYLFTLFIYFFIFIFFFFAFFREKEIWHFVWIVCLADNSHKMSSLIFLKKKKNTHTQKKKISGMLSASILLSAFALKPLWECFTMQHMWDIKRKWWRVD